MSLFPGAGLMAVPGGRMEGFRGNGNGGGRREEMAEVNLDDVAQLAAGDPSGMLGEVEGLPAQCLEALEIGRGLQDLPSSAGIRRVAFAGMGGSAIGGDVLRVLLQDEVSLPITVHRGYSIPLSMGRDTLLFAVSYSGNTEETLSAVEAAMRQGCAIVAASSGGTLSRWAEDSGLPLIRVPAGKQPRAALAYLSLPMGVVLERMGMVEGFSSRVERAVEKLRKKKEEWGRLSPTQSNLAKQMAHRLVGKIPVIYGAGEALSVAAYRWKCQFNENSKAPAFCHALPEMDHNEIVGFQERSDLTRLLEVVFLVSEEETPRMRRRVEITAEIVGEAAGGVTVLHVGGANDLERLFTALFLGDLVSVYLALLRGIDPTPVESIAALKKRMAEA